MKGKKKKFSVYCVLPLTVVLSLKERTQLENTTTKDTNNHTERIPPVLWMLAKSLDHFLQRFSYPPLFKKFILFHHPLYSLLLSLYI